MSDDDIACVDASVAECACTENDGWDSDCCALAADAGCIAGYTMKQLTSAGYCDGSAADNLAGPISTCCVPIENYFENDERGLGNNQVNF